MWIGGRPAWDEAETIAVASAIVIAVVLALISAGAGLIEKKRRWRVAAMCVLCFGFGTAFGIDLTAKGWFWLRLSVMQEQLQTLWHFPSKRLEPPR
jgi:hypothetical protein